MDDQERHDALAELEGERDAIEHQMLRLTRGFWQFALGRIRLRLPVNSQMIAQLYVLFNAALLIGGSLLILVGTGVATELGIALVVGALFSIGAFAAAVWVLTVEGEREAFHRSFGPDVGRELEELRLKRDALVTEIETLSAEDTEK